jgi:hypothetical protein
MSLNAGKSRLSGATRELMLQWLNTKEYWRDQKSAEFEKKYLNELAHFADKSVQIMEKLDEILKKVRSDCE